MNVLPRFWRFGAFLLLPSALLVTSCKKNEEITPSPAVVSSTVATGVVTDKEVNDWILENMKFWYFWNDKLPATTDKSLTPDKYFDSLLNKFDATTNPTGDRFSWIQKSAEELKASLSGEQTTTGMEYKLFLRETGSSDVIAKVLYVQRNSPADKAGVKRGDIITSVNGTKMTTGNYSSLISGEGTTKTYGFATIEGNKIVDTASTKTITAVVYQANPVYLDSVYTIQGKKIGYLVYNQFVPGPNNTNTAAYDQQLRTVFGKFKAKGITEFVLDLRYNPGGYVSSSTVLGSLIAKGASSSKLFYKKEYNKTLTPEYQAYDKSKGTDSFNGFFYDEVNNIGGNLQRVYVLITSGSASASELVINGLRPYMDVITLGTTSYGKNVGSITITDTKGRIKWGMQPIVSKTYNSLNQSDYSTGFVPKVEVREFTNVAWKPLGDVSDALLNEAIFQITGSRSGRVAARDGIETPSLGSSIERKAGGSNMFFSENLSGLK
jgi:carboxyl-terminal processing protease